MLKAYDADGKLMMLGVDYTSSTYMHVVVARHWHHRRQTDPDAAYEWIKREALGAYWDSLGRMNRGQLGDADCRLFGIRDFVDTLLEAVEREPDTFLKRWPAISQPRSISACP